MINEIKRRIDVAVAVILNSQMQVLTAWRQSHQHQGNLWEFPGGKCEANESILDALKRELVEEIGVQVIEAKHLIELTHDYSDKLVRLHVWLVSEYHGDPHGQEGQELRWQDIDELEPNLFPAANAEIITELKNLRF